MTSYPDQGTQQTLWSGGLDLTKITPPQPSTGEEDRRFWASAQRWMTSTHRDIMEVSFGSARMINHISLKVSRFPLTMKVQYLDANGDWQAVTYANTGPKKKKPHREIKGNPVMVSISTSRPKRVNSARATAHPQHFGKGHWARHSWKIRPVTTNKVRFVFTRNANGNPPVNPRGQRVPYSVALKDVEIGYRVIDHDDIPVRPTPANEWWASSEDILGSRTVYSTYTQPADSVIDGNTGTYWRSEPQPFPFAVVNLFLDVRGEAGDVPVIDRFWLDPVTVGPICNLYYSSDEPSGDFDGLSDPIPSQWRTEYGNPLIERDAATQVAYAIDLGPDVQSGIEVSNVHERLRYDLPWWVGVDGTALVDATSTDWHPIITLGAVQIAQDGASLVVVDPTGVTASVDLDPTTHVLNAPYRLVAAYFPYDEATQRDPYLRLVYNVEGYDPVVTEMAIPALADYPSPVRIGLAPDPDDTSIPAIGIKGLVVKSESLEDDIQQWFLDEGAAFVADPDTAQSDRMTAQNARLRMHPQFLSETNIFGVVGGAGNRFREMAWTPVMRDYTLKRGYLHLPPTKAAYWKFEITRLAPQSYENFVTINRDALVFPPDVVDHYDGVTGKSNNTVPFGVQTTANTVDTITYADVLNAVRQSPPAPEATDVLVVSDPRRAAEVAQSGGWVWTYQPWHMGSEAPKFLGTQVHHYESIRVSHNTKVAFFAAIRELMPYRVDYTFADDTPEYVEHLIDDAFLDEQNSVVLYEGGVRSIGASGEVTSKPLTSYRTVRGVQFATQETDAYQVIDDPDFAASDLSRWTPYGDADLIRLDQNDVLVSRGYIGYTYAHWEQFTYGEMETTDTGDTRVWEMLEGTAPTGYAEGGMSSAPYSPSGAGKVQAIVEVSASDPLRAPIRVEVVATETGQVVAYSEKYLQQGEKATLNASYTPGTLMERHTYADIENFIAGQVDEGYYNDTSVLAQGTSDASDDTYYETDPTTAGIIDLTDAGTLSPANDTSSPTDWTNFDGSYVIHVRYQSSLPVQFIARPAGGADIDLGPGALPASPDGVSQADFTVLGAAPGVVLPDLHLAALVGPPVTGDYLRVMDWWVEVTMPTVATDAATTYGSLEAFSYNDLESSLKQTSLMVRVRQQGKTTDDFHIHRVALYDSPIAWFFSNDGGITWWQAVDVRNDPYAVLLFPEPLPGADVTPEQGKSLLWKAQLYRDGATINALHIRPWYGDRFRTVEGAHTMEALGPNTSIYDNMPATVDHPMWLPRLNTIEHIFTEPIVIPFWRNLAITPGGEGAATDGFETSGGTVETQAPGWTIMVPESQAPVDGGGA